MFLRVSFKINAYRCISNLVTNIIYNMYIDIQHIPNIVLKLYNFTFMSFFLFKRIFFSSGYQPHSYFVTTFKSPHRIILYVYIVYCVYTDYLYNVKLKTKLCPELIYSSLKRYKTKLNTFMSHVWTLIIIIIQ